MFYWTIDQPGRVQGIGYSSVWDILKVNLLEESTGEDTLIYSGAEEWLIAPFMLSGDPDRYFSTFIEGYLPRLFI